MELTAPVAYLSAHTRFIRWVTTLDAAHSLPDVKTPGTSSLGPLKVLQDCQKLLTDSGLKETGDADDDGRANQGQKPAPTLVSLGSFPATGRRRKTTSPPSGSSRDTSRVAPARRPPCGNCRSEISSR